MYASAYGTTAKASIATIEKKFFILNPFYKLSTLTKRLYAFVGTKASGFIIFSII